MVYAKRTDANQKDIVAVLRHAGATVSDLSMVGKGVPDLLVGYRGVNILMEIKRDEKAPYKPTQIEWMKAWEGAAPYRIETTEQALKVLSAFNKP